MSYLDTYKEAVLGEYTDKEVSIVFKSELLQILQFLKVLSDLLETGKMFENCNEEMSYVNILNGGDFDEIQLLEKYLALKTSIDRNRGHVEYLDKVVDFVQKAGSIEEVDELMRQVHGVGKK